MAKVSKFGLLLLVVGCHSGDKDTTPKNAAGDQGLSLTAREDTHRLPRVNGGDICLTGAQIEPS